MTFTHVVFPDKKAKQWIHEYTARIEKGKTELTLKLETNILSNNFRIIKTKSGLDRVTEIIDLGISATKLASGDATALWGIYKNIKGKGMCNSGNVLGDIPSEIFVRPDSVFADEQHYLEDNKNDCIDVEIGDEGRYGDILVVQVVAVRSLEKKPERGKWFKEYDEYLIGNILTIVVNIFTHHQYYASIGKILARYAKTTTSEEMDFVEGIKK